MSFESILILCCYITYLICSFWPILTHYSGINLDGSTIGIAFIGSMCSNTHSVGVTQDGGRSLALVASTAAHELGHIFNMDHDGIRIKC